MIHDLQLNNMLENGVDDRTSINVITHSICSILVEISDTFELIKKGDNKKKKA